MTNEQELILKEESPLSIIKMAIDSGQDLDKMEKFLNLQERWESNQAKKAYNADMVKVQKDIPIVNKTIINSITSSKYASLDNIIFETKKIYTEHGFSISFYENETTKPEHIRVCADVIHKLGHKETYYYDAPMEGKGLKGNVNMTATHAKASSVSYARRYLMCMIWNIPTGNDNDGNVVEENIDENKISILEKLMDEVKADKVTFLKYLNIEKLEDLPKSGFAKAKLALEAKRGKI